MTLAALRDHGPRSASTCIPACCANMVAEVRPSDHAILYLTSGATGEPKMALVTHQAIVANLDMGPAVLPLGPQDSTVAFLPSAHIAQRVVIELLPMRCGMPVTFAESLMKLPQDIRKVRPTILLAPPRMWERIYSTICTELRKRPARRPQGLLRRARRWRWRPRATAAKASPSRCASAARCKVADRLMFRKVRGAFRRPPSQWPLPAPRR